jgi:hypothetical protein
MNNVRAVLSAKQWNALRGMVADQAWNVCELCGGTGPKHPVECHEIWDYNEKTATQTLTGMIALCPDCHMVKHFGFARIQGKEELAFKHFMKVNGLKKKAAEAEIAKAFDVWRKRSLIDWKLDLSGLKKYGLDVSKIKAPFMKPMETE